MKRLVRSAFWLVATAFLSLSPVAAQERSITLLPGTDLPGFDYSVKKDVSLDACEAACTEDRLCRAFTFNESAKWCFLKGDVGTEAAFEGATSGRVEFTPTRDEINQQRLGELPFPAQDLLDSARYYANGLPQTDAPPPGVTYDDLVASGDEASAQSNPSAAMVSYRQALAINRNDPALWLKLAAEGEARADIEAAAGNGTYDLAVNGSYAALNAFMLSETPQEKAAALGVLGKALERREMWRESIAAYRASVGLIDDTVLQARLDKVVAEHGFRVTSNQVDAEAAEPRICAVFSDPLPAGDTDLSSYVVVDNAPTVAIESDQSQICVTGVEHGRRYHIRLRAGLPSANGEQLRSDVELDLYVPDRAPFVGFANNAYVMPAGLGGGLPITSINAKSADVVIYRIGDRNIATAVRNGIFQRTLDGYSAEDVANSYGEKTWEGSVDLAQGAPNAMTVTAIPVSEAIQQLQPGAYVVTAKVSSSQQEYWREMATQWFIVTDLGLTTVSGDDGVHAFVRSLTSAQPVANAKVRLVAVNNEILGEATTDAEGRADFAPGLARGEGGRAPQLVVAETGGGDYAFLDVSKSAFDLTDRGVEGRPSPGPLDVFATTERGVYRPGETVFLTAILRDIKAKAVTDLPLTMQVQRPDAVIDETQVINDGGAGGYFQAIDLAPEAMRGSWSIRLYADPKASALTTVGFLVEDFEPERLAFEISAADEPIVTGEVTPVTVAAKYLYGATAPDLAIEADAVLRPVSSLPGFAGYTFGRLDDPFQTSREPLGVVGTTDADGNATAEVVVSEPQATTKPLEAQLIMRLVDSNGRAVERSLSRPVLATTDRIGVKPRFESADGLTEGSQAVFDVIAVAPDGAQIDKAGLEWSLSRVETNYQWYRNSGVWKWEAITTTREVANGTVDTTASGPAAISAAVDWGLYRLEVSSTGEGATSTSYEFYAGYYYPQVGSDTPDTLSVALDKPAYRSGETAVLKLDPQFAGTALVMVVDDRIIDMKAVEVPEGGASVELPVTDDWGPGAYVTAMLYRPASAEAKRMPARALGVAFADVDPGDLKLDMALEAPETALPRQAFSTTVKLANVQPGDKAYVAVAAVDLGILNLTKFQVPDPDGYFFGQRQLGMEFRDLYGQLIDPMQGTPGALRVGGDEGASRLGTPPATTVLVALHSGIVEVGPDGTATVSFDMPDFNGTVRLMAMAWSAKAVGHASADVVVRDPVVVNLSPPRFLRYGDTSRLLVEVTNIAGQPGTYTVSLDTGEGLSTDALESTIELGVGDRAGLDLKLTGTGIGDNKLTVTVRAPNGDAQVKELTLGVRAASAPQTTSQLIPLAVGETVTLDGSLFDGMVPHTGEVTLALGPIARLDVPGILLALDRYPYGCAEQISSRALPLLYLNEVASMVGIGTDAELDQRIRDAIRNLLSKQTSSGGFGLWDPYSTTDLWLDSYVSEFLIRAKAAGYEVPELAMSRALDNLSNQVSYAADFSLGGEDVAFALYDLARAGRAAIGDLRYYLEARLNNFGSPLAKAQLGAALALYGDRTRAATAFAAAVEGLGVAEERYKYRGDYGSLLRDTAGVLALAAEFKPSGVDIAELTTKLANMRDRERWTSTQEDAWTLVAASALGQSAADGSLAIDGEALTGSPYRRYDQEHFDGLTVEVTNNGNQPTDMKVTTTAIPAEPPTPSENGFTLTRDYYTVTGEPADFSAVRQNDRFVVVLTAQPTRLGSGQYVIADPLPAGFEIENPNLLQGSGVADLSWLTVDQPTHVESRTDQFVAAYRFTSDISSVTAAYLVRAVSPGTFVMPGATVEDMYRPDLRANTSAGSIEIGPTGP
ncbi:alpha-2-macroglobulin family protein [Devosia sp. ZB163]|uniref:alpha-2-macroglobulin family protein n=1 Tax=Devosia sp. ZB163 TaxID=3025938 RepID=UPI00235EE5DE|nr:alpha-2-macroglobulin family protein [Devosia sp. ZB163]MDC9825245.1 alpha-2-macroglobulin family protein [Devosia sp. ZB163]